MLDSNKLKGKIAEAGLTQRELAKKAGMSENSLYNKINGRRDFGAREIVAILTLKGEKLWTRLYQYSPAALW